MKESARNLIYEFFIESVDFNGIPLRNISQTLQIEYVESIDLIIELVQEGFVSIQSSTNPHIILFRHYTIADQVHLLREAKSTTVKTEQFGDIIFSIEQTEYPLCLYPTPQYLLENRDLDNLEGAVYTKQLALAAPQLEPIFFDIDVLDRYYNDPRFDFEFLDYSGKVQCNYNENGTPCLREEDQVFLKSFGIGYDEQGNRVAVVFRRYLHDLTPEHQFYWKGKQAKGNCKIVKEYYENLIQGRWIFPKSFFSAFLQELKWINVLTNTIFGQSLFRESFEEEKRPRDFTFFFVPTLKNYQNFVLLLDKMLSDNINKSFFDNKGIALYKETELRDGKIERIPKGTIALLEEWLASVYKPVNGTSSDLLFNPLKDIRKQRQNPAHKINPDRLDKIYFKMQSELIEKAYQVLMTFRMIFHEHPRARSISLPGLHDNDPIIPF